MDTSGVTAEAIMQHEIEQLEEQQKNVIEKYKRQLKDCVNELCYRCGKIEQCRKERKQKCF